MIYVVMQVSQCTFNIFTGIAHNIFSCYLYLQLRNLVWSTSKHDVYLMSDFSVIHWSSLSPKKTEVLNVFGHVAPCEVHLFLRSYFESFQLWALGFLFRKYSWTDISLTETPWKFTGRIYSNTSKHFGCPWQFVDCWGIPGRAHLQGNLSHGGKLCHSAFS